jgi:hypothetical protein
LTLYNAFELFLSQSKIWDAEEKQPVTGIAEREILRVVGFLARTNQGLS